MNPLRTLRQFFDDVARSRQLLDEIRASVANLSGKIEEVGEGSDSPQQTYAFRSEFIPLYPIVDLRDAPIQEIMAASEYEECARSLELTGRPQDSLMSCYSQALLYCLIRNMRPDFVVEIGTYRAGTAEVICRALSANNSGVLRTIDPFGRQTVPNIVKTWPPTLRNRLRFHPISSMDFFFQMAQTEERPDIILVDGNHDFEFAQFDIEAAARIIKPGGFLFVDNISQAGPYLAAQSFISRHVDWIDCVGSVAGDISAEPFDKHRTRLTNTDFCVLRAPSHLTLTSRPYSPGQIRWPSRVLHGIAIRGVGELGQLDCQCVIRTFGINAVIGETSLKASAEITPDEETRIAFEDSPAVAASAAYVTIEPWLTWHGASPLLVHKWNLY